MNSIEVDQWCHARRARRDRVCRMQMDYEMHLVLDRYNPDADDYGIVAEGIPVIVHLTSVGGDWAYDGFSYQTTRVDQSKHNRIVYESIKATGAYPLDKVFEEEIKRRLGTPRTHMHVDIEWRIACSKAKQAVEERG